MEGGGKEGTERKGRGRKGSGRGQGEQRDGRTAEGDIVVAEKDDGKRFTATFRAGVILRMRRELRGL